MKTNQLQLNKKNKEKGQSFVELILVFGILMTLMAGMVEFGNLLNLYINLVDGAREGARYESNDDPITKGYPAFDDQVYEVVQGRFKNGVQESKGAINPIVLDPATDDIVVSVYSFTGKDPAHGYDKSLTLLDSSSRYGNHTTSFTTTELLTKMNTLAPNSGVLVVEVFYSYHQILKLFSFLPGIPDPIEVSAYSIMPLSAAEPTPTIP